jgi:CYTH domain-containing protein/CHAD domain-containing protein
MPGTTAIPISDRLLSSHPALGARQLVRSQLRAMAAALDALENTPGDARALHQLRVAARQVRTLLRTFHRELTGVRPRRRARELRALVRRTGSQRDRDVLATLLDSLTAVLPARTRAAIVARRDLILGAAPAEHAFDRDAWRTFVRRLERDTQQFRTTLDVDGGTTHAPFAEVLADALSAATAVLDAQLAAVDDANPAHGEHAARIAGKRLRYLVQPFAELSPDARSATSALRALQDALGERRDAHLLHLAVNAAMDAMLPRPPMAAISALRRAIDARLASHEDAVTQWRTGSAMAALRTSLNGFARAARAASPPVEIERKYLLSTLPPAVRSVPATIIQQGYLPGTEVLERIRSLRSDTRTRWMRTVKVGQGVARLEFEEEVLPSFGERLYALTDGARVEKRRYAVPAGTHTWEVDDFTDRDLVLAEVELSDAEEAVEIPAWLAPYLVREVTDDPDFTNAALAR